jgi:hypothetical protein
MLLGTFIRDLKVSTERWRCFEFLAQTSVRCFPACQAVDGPENGNLKSVLRFAKVSQFLGGGEKIAARGHEMAVKVGNCQIAAQIA